MRINFPSVFPLVSDHSTDFNAIPNDRSEVYVSQDAMFVFTSRATSPSMKGYLYAYGEESANSQTDSPLSSPHDDLFRHDTVLQPHLRDVYYFSRLICFVFMKHFHLRGSKTE